MSARNQIFVVGQLTAGVDADEVLTQKSESGTVKEPWPATTDQPIDSPPKADGPHQIFQSPLIRDCSLNELIVSQLDII